MKKVVLVLLLAAAAAAGYMELSKKELAADMVWGQGRNGDKLHLLVKDFEEVEITTQQRNQLLDSSRTNVAYVVVYEQDKWFGTNKKALDILRFERPFPKTDWEAEPAEDMYYKLVDESVYPINEDFSVYVALYEQYADFHSLIGLYPVPTIVPKVNGIVDAKLPGVVEEPIIKNHVEFTNFDKLSSRSSTGRGVTYSEEELAAMEQEEWRKDLHKSVRWFVEKNLFGEITFMKSVEGTYNPRIVLVGGNHGGNVFGINMVKRHTHGGIWTATGYFTVEEPNERTQDALEYRFADLTEVDEAVRQWAESIIGQNKAAEEVYILSGEQMADDKTYILLAAPEGESIDILEIRPDNISVSLDYGLSEPLEQYGRMPYVLLEFDGPATDIVIYQYTSPKRKDIRSYM